MTREVTNEYYSGQGRLIIGKRDPVTGKSYDLRHVGNVTALSVEIAVEKFEHKESYSGNRATDATQIKSQKATIKFTAESLSPENLAMGLYGASVKVLGDDVVDEAHKTDGGGMIPLKYPNVSAVTVKVGATAIGATALVEGTDYTVDEEFGTIYQKDPAKFTGKTAYVSYTYGDSTRLDVFTNPVPAERFLRFEGLNTADGKKHLLNVPRLTFDPLPALQLINEEFGSAEFTGNVLLDPLIDAAEGSQFMEKFSF
jgi:hypothetical protein